MDFRKVRSKKKTVTASETLDQKHNDMMEKFERDKKELPKKKKKLAVLQKSLQTLMDKRRTGTCTQFDFWEIGELEKEIRELEAHVDDVSNNKSETDYIMKAMPILSRYYALDEKNEKKDSDKVTIDSSGLHGIEAFIGRDDNADNKKALLKEYMIAVYGEYDDNLDDYNDDLCPNCDEEGLEEDLREGCLICYICGCSVARNISNGPSYKETQETELSQVFTYERQGHFDDWVNRLQGQESSNVPQKIFQDVTDYLNKHGYKDFSKLTVRKVREVLKATNNSKYYNNKYSIWKKLSGKEIHIPDEAKNTMSVMFEETQEPFARHKHLIKDRSNYLNYSYILYKFLELLEYDDILPHLRLLQDRKLLNEHDRVWKAMCKDLRWEFIPTL